MDNSLSISPAAAPVADLEYYAERLDEYTNERVASPEELLTSAGEPPHNASLTAVAAEALRTGVYPEAREALVPGEDDLLRAGDPDIDPLENLYSDEELAGGSMPSPDQNDVDNIGRISGLGEVDSGTLHSTEEVMERRDSRRWEMEPLSPKV